MKHRKFWLRFVWTVPLIATKAKALCPAILEHNMLTSFSKLRKPVRLKLSSSNLLLMVQKPKPLQKHLLLRQPLKQHLQPLPLVALHRKNSLR